MSMTIDEKVATDVVDLDDLMALARQLDDEDQTVRPAVLCNIVGAM